MEFELMTYRLVDHTFIHCAMLIDNNFGVENIYKIILYFIVYFDGKYVTMWRCPILASEMSVIEKPSILHDCPIPVFCDTLTAAHNITGS